MNRFIRIAAVLVPLGLAACTGGLVAPDSHEEGLLEVNVAQQCAREMLAQYAECRALECETNPLRPLPYDRLCDRTCAAEADLAYEECAADAADLTAITLPNEVAIPQYHEPDVRILDHAGPTPMPCVTCGAAR